MLFGLVGESVSVSLNMPDSAQSDSEFLVEVTIRKGDVEGFARFQQKLPNGFKAVARQTANGTWNRESAVLRNHLLCPSGFR